jgi:hypothetical protein
MIIQELHTGHYLVLVQGPLLSCVGIIASALDGRSEGPPFKSCLCQPAVWSSGVVLTLVAGSPGFNSRLLRPLAPPGAAGCRRSRLGSPLSCSPWHFFLFLSLSLSLSRALCLSLSLSLWLVMFSRSSVIQDVVSSRHWAG